MFLTRCALNPARRGAMKLLGSPQVMHAAVMAAFPPEDGEPGSAEQAGGRVLWRVDAEQRSRYLFVLSPTAPDLTHVVEQAGWPTRSAWDSRPYGPLLSRLTEGQEWAFRLRANPTKMAKDVGKRVGHVTAEQQVAWLVDRAPRLGFEVVGEADAPSVRLSERDKRDFRRADSQVTLVTARYDGLLCIADAALFRKTLVDGIGRAKAYGCGLMTLARPAT